MPSNINHAHNAWLHLQKQKLQAIISKATEEQQLIIRALTTDINTATWLKLIPTLPHQIMTDQECWESIRFRLGVDDEVYEYTARMPQLIWKKENKKEEVLSCPCCTYKLDKFHYSNCQSTGPLRTSRHNMIKKLLANLLSEIPSIAVVVEDSHFEEKDSTLQKLIPDLTVSLIDYKISSLEKEYDLQRNHPSHPILKFGIDIVVTDIFAQHNRNTTKTGKFAEIGEERKWKTYSKLNERSNFKVLPFGLSSIGGLGPCAVHIMNFIIEQAHRQHKQISLLKTMEQISFIIESSRTMMKELYISIINERLRRTRISAPKAEMEPKDIITTPVVQSSKAAQSTLPSFWQKQFRLQQKIETAGLIEDGEDYDYPWLSLQYRRTIEEEDKESRSLRIILQDDQRLEEENQIVPEKRAKTSESSNQQRNEIANEQIGEAEEEEESDKDDEQNNPSSNPPSPTFEKFVDVGEEGLEEGKGRKIRQENDGDEEWNFWQRSQARNIKFQTANSMDEQ